LITVAHTRAELNALELRAGGAPVALVPTMGALHAGHLELVARAAAWGKVVVSIFVNPTQFGPGEDFERYPRDLESDLSLMAPLGVAAVFAPDVSEMYATGEGVTVKPGGRAAPLCGARRPGHFAGVLTVVAKLLNLVGPDVAVFGRKDAQQCLVIDEMVRDLCLPVVLKDVPTVREADGLAMSSRNRYLDLEQRGRARCVPQALAAVRQALAEGERDVEVLEDLLALNLAPADVVEYAEIRTLPELGTLESADGRILAAVAVHIGNTRLIDNLAVAVSADSVADTPLLQEVDA
jgi:pantoate--beta-alanine ligase